MPLLADRTGKKKVIVVSALDELEYDQAERFKAMGLTATAVNSQVWSDELHKILRFPHSFELPTHIRIFDIRAGKRP
ncbi:hypothetical protein EW026_g7034 [Hermanssonia centrifuga]|uniref:Uncharacterized protein n=1 Tax=Hermanssonia centrifuga TaxID=98765 RepID=A0A4V3X9J7_9APHY|nr:hypothetical protein EW026_g7034 [Hermanssonia centrifuga]